MSKVKVLNRGDCCGERLNGFSVRVDDIPCATNVQISQGESKVVECAGTGSSVTIYLPTGRFYLSLCEVKVFAAPFSGVLQWSSGLHNEMCSSGLYGSLAPAGTPCVFPFTWTDGITHDLCLGTGYGGLGWCGTAVTSTASDWGACTPCSTAPPPLSPPPPPLSIFSPGTCMNCSHGHVQRERRILARGLLLLC